MMGMGHGLQRRLLLLLLTPLLALAALNSWFDYRLSDTRAIQQDRVLLSLVPQLADAIPAAPLASKDLQLAPDVSAFFVERPQAAAYAVLDGDGKLLWGAPWLATYPPYTHEPEFSSEERQGRIYRIVTQRVVTAAGELTIRLADGMSLRQQRVQRLWRTVLLPNALLVLAAFLSVTWAVRRAFAPLLALKDGVAARGPRDLTPLDERGSPDEVRPLVQSLNQLFVLVNAQMESQRRFVADAAHQLRTPLAGLQAQVEAWAHSAQALGGGQHVTLAPQQVLALRESTRRTSQLAHQLLALSRADAHSAHAQPAQSLDLQSVCEAQFEAMLDGAAEKKIDLGLDAAPAQVRGYEWLLRELVANVLDNALRYTPAGGRVTLRCGVLQPGTGQPAQGFVQVEDDGPGIAAQERARVLQRFYRVPGTPGQGNGLGLAIADEIARVHQSQLQLDHGAGGRGLCVTWTLPLAAGE